MTATPPASVPPLKRSALRHRLGWAVLLTAPLLSGCSALGYYWQSVSGHHSLMQAARPVQELLDDPATSAALKARLELAQQIRRYAVQALHLPDNASYQRYADLKRAAAVWNVSAAPEFSLRPVAWCFWVAGCVNYKGFYDEAQARQEAKTLRAQGLEVSVYPVPAYSTLGWLNWAGGDPLLNTFIHTPEAELAGLIFHELAHQVVYAVDDTAFNESFATAVESLGRRSWLVAEASPQVRLRQAQRETRRQAFRALVSDLRRTLQAVYGESNLKAESETEFKAGPSADTKLITDAMRAAKASAYQGFAQRYAALKADWGAHNGYDPWVARLNNASLSTSANYEHWVPAFEAMFKAQGDDWPRFYAEVRRLAAQPKAERQAQLDALMPAPAQNDVPSLARALPSQP